MATSAIGAAIGMGQAGGSVPVASFGGGAMGGMSSGLGGGGGITELGSTIASGVEGLLNRRAAKKAAKKAREWQERMRATAYQTAVKDLELAGLNPALALVGPGPASAPSAAIPDVRTRTDFSGLRNAISRGLSTAKQAKMFDDEVATVRAGRSSAESEAKYRGEALRAGISANYAQQTLAEDQALRARSERKLTETENRLRRLELPSAEAQSRFDATETGQLLRQFRRMMDSLPSIGGTYGRPHRGGGSGSVRTR